VIVIDRAGACDVYHTENVINAGAVDEFAGKNAIVVFGDNIAAVTYSLPTLLFAIYGQRTMDFERRNMQVDDLRERG
jgi:class 3 adenylate cyclase